MSPEQLQQLQKLRASFESGFATSADIKELSELLTLINHRHEDETFHKTQLDFNSFS